MGNPPTTAVAYQGRVKYDETRARKYQHRPAAKHAGEMRLLDRAFRHIPKSHQVLDVPCGGGRVSIHLARQGYRLSAADLSPAMLAVAQENFTAAGLDLPAAQQDVERLTLADRSVDTIVSFRLFHHFPDAAIRERVVREFCRVAREHVVLSYFSPASLTSARNRLRAALGGRPLKKYPTSLAEVRGYFEAAGFELVADHAQLPLVHTLHVAVFRRRGGRR